MKTEFIYKNKLTTESCFHLHKILDSVDFYLDDEYPYCDIEFSTKDEDYQKLELSQKTLIADNVNTDEYRHSIVKGFNNSLSAETHFYFTNKKCCLYCFMLILRI